MRLEGTRRRRAQAKVLRRALTPPEIGLWLALRSNQVGLRFRRQHAAGDYVLDFYCAPARLAVEVDGEAHERGDRPVRDARRDAWLAAQGIRTLRYSARAVLTNVEGGMQQIIAVALARSGRVPPPPTPPAPPPPGGGG